MLFQSGQVGATDPDRFAFILLQDVDSGTVVSFTDNAMLNQNPIALCTNEGFVNWTAGSNLPAGSIVQISADSAVSSGFVSGSLSFSQNGDQILAFQTSTNNDTLFIGAISSSNWLSVCSAGCGNTAGNNSATCLPSNLSEGVDVVNFSSEMNNSFFNLSLFPSFFYSHNFSLNRDYLNRFFRSVQYSNILRFNLKIKFNPYILHILLLF